MQTVHVLYLEIAFHLIWSNQIWIIMVKHNSLLFFYLSNTLSAYVLNCNFGLQYE